MDEAQARDVLAAAGVLPGAARTLGSRWARTRCSPPVTWSSRWAATPNSSTGRGGSWTSRSGSPRRASRRYGPPDPKARLVEGHPVTVWHRLPDPVRAADTRRSGRTPTDRARPALPRSFTLPRRELLGGVERWLRLAGDAIDPADAALSARAPRRFRRRPPPRSPRISRRARSTATRSPATSTSAPTGRSWSTWRPSPPICANTTWWSWRCPATGTACPPRPTTRSRRRTAGTCGSGKGAGCCAGPARRRAAPGSRSMRLSIRRRWWSSRGGWRPCGQGDSSCAVVSVLSA